MGVFASRVFVSPLAPRTSINLSVQRYNSFIPHQNKQTFDPFLDLTSEWVWLERMPYSCGLCSLEGGEGRHLGEEALCFFFSKLFPFPLPAPPSLLPLVPPGGGGGGDSKRRMWGRKVISKDQVDSLIFCEDCEDMVREAHRLDDIILRAAERLDFLKEQAREKVAEDPLEAEDESPVRTLIRHALQQGGEEEESETGSGFPPEPVPPLRVVKSEPVDIEEYAEDDDGASFGFALGPGPAAESEQSSEEEREHSIFFPGRSRKSRTRKQILHHSEDESEVEEEYKPYAAKRKSTPRAAKGKKRGRGRTSAPPPSAKSKKPRKSAPKVEDHEEEEQVNRSVKRRMESAGFEKKKTCPVCARVYPTVQEMEEHLNLVHTDQITHRCNYCAKGFIKHSTYRQHKVFCTKRPRDAIVELIEKLMKEKEEEESGVGNDASSASAQGKGQSHSEEISIKVNPEIFQGEDQDHENGNENEASASRAAAKPEPQDAPAEEGGAGAATATPKRRQKSFWTCPVCTKVFDRLSRLKEHLFHVNNCSDTILYGTTRPTHPDGTPLKRRVPGMKTPEEERTCFLCNRVFENPSKLQRHLKTFHPESLSGPTTATSTGDGDGWEMGVIVNNSANSSSIYLGNQPVLCDHCGISYKNDECYKKHLKRSQRCRNIREGIIKEKAVPSSSSGSRSKNYYKPKPAQSRALRKDGKPRDTTETMMNPNLEIPDGVPVCPPQEYKPVNAGIRQPRLPGERRRGGGKRGSRTPLEFRTCATCGAVFETISRLRQHRRCAHGSKPYVVFICPVCKRGFLRQNEMLKHKDNGCRAVRKPRVVKKKKGQQGQGPPTPQPQQRQRQRELEERDEEYSPQGVGPWSHPAYPYPYPHLQLHHQH